MSEYIPLEIQMVIIKRLPVKTLIQLRFVSKPWKSFIDSPEFIAGYGVRHTQPHRLILRYNNFLLDEKYVSFVDDDNNTFNLTKLIDHLSVVDSSRGLLCLYGYYQDLLHSRYKFGTYMTVLWNSSIRKSIGIEVPSALDWPSDTVVGFGICPINNDPTIVKISCVDMIWKMKNRATASIPWQVQAFTLSSGNWTILSSNTPRESIRVGWCQMIIDRFIYWLGNDTIVNMDGEFLTSFLIVSFDLITKEFRGTDLPDNLAHEGCYIKSISKLRESLVVLEYSIEVEVEESVCSLWMMEHGVKNSFTKLFTINASDTSVNRLLGFRKNGEPITETQHQYDRFATLEVYDPCLGRINSLEIYGEDVSFFMGSYMESLLLLDQSTVLYILTSIDHKDVLYIQPSSVVIKIHPFCCY